MPRKVVFLDRDGTINVDHGYVHRQEDWEFVPDVIEGLKLLQEAGFLLTVITNQSGIAQGLYTTQDMRKLHEYMVEELAKEGITIDAIAFCPHGRDSTCECRKPGPLMAKHIEEQVGAIDYPNSWTVGDKEADVGFGQANGTKTAIIRSKYWQDGELTTEPDLVVDSLKEAARRITKVTSNMKI